MEKIKLPDLSNMKYDTVDRVVFPINDYEAIREAIAQRDFLLASISWFFSRRPYISRADKCDVSEILRSNALAIEKMVKVEIEDFDMVKLAKAVKEFKDAENK